MGLFGGGGNSAEDEKEKTSTTISIGGTGQLPTKDMAEYVADNMRIPDKVRADNWARDIPSIALSKLGAEGRRHLAALSDINEDIKYLYRQKTYIYVPGVDLSRDMGNLDYNIPFAFAMTKADDEGGTPLIDKLLSSSTLVETRKGETKANTGEPSRRRRMFGII